MNVKEIYQSKDNKKQVEVLFDGNTVWLSQQHMAALFILPKQNISLRINNCFKEKEVEKNSVVRESLTTAADGKKYLTKYYNLNVIISVGYRVKSLSRAGFHHLITTKFNLPLLTN